MIRLFLSCILCYSLIGCVKNNPDPVFLEIAAWKLVKNTELEAKDAGELSHNFTDAWVYVDGKLLGIFELPCKVPALVEGSNVEVAIYPAIRNNGISDVKKVYPFCDVYKVNLNFTPGAVHKLEPTTRYSTSCKFWIENFEDPSMRIDSDPNFNAKLIRDNLQEHLFSPGFYGHVHLNANDTIFQGYSKDQFYLPKGGKEVYMEINYKNSTSLIAGVVEYTTSSTIYAPYLIITPQADPPVWKKMYVDLRETVSSATSSVAFDVLLKAGIAASEGDKDIYIDNVKIIYN